MHAYRIVAILLQSCSFMVRNHAEAGLDWTEERDPKNPDRPPPPDKLLMKHPKMLRRTTQYFFTGFLLSSVLELALFHIRDPEDEEPER